MQWHTVEAGEKVVYDSSRASILVIMFGWPSCPWLLDWLVVYGWPILLSHDCYFIRFILPILINPSFMWMRDLLCLLVLNMLWCLLKMRNAVLLSALAAQSRSLIFWFSLYLADIIAAAFFPANTSAAMAKIQGLGLFAIGYLARPFGGVIFGRFGDISGRKPILLMQYFGDRCKLAGDGLLANVCAMGYGCACFIHYFTPDTRNGVWAFCTAGLGFCVRACAAPIFVSRL